MNLLIDLKTKVTNSFSLATTLKQFLINYNHLDTYNHCALVAEEARNLAKRFGVNEDDAEMAGYLHDVSAIFPNHERIRVAREFGLEVLPEEEAFPMIIHQKLSRVLAKELFHIEKEEILNAIECHTTLKNNPTKLDLVLFVADKIKWDQKGTPPYIKEIESGLDHSLETAAYAYISFLWRQRDKLKVIHPWLRAAYHDMGSDPRNRPY